METPEYTIERLSASNAHHVPVLFAKVFNKVVTKEHLLKKYNTAYTGIEAVGAIAFDKEGNPIGFQGYIPCKLICSGRIEIGIQSCDSMVVKEFRGRRMFSDIQQFGMKLAFDAGASFMYGFGNQASTPIVVKQGWTAKDELKRFVIPTGSIPFGKAIQKLGMRSLFQRYVRFVLRKYIRPYNNEFIKSSDEVQVLYDKDYLNYKSYYNSHFIIMDGIPVWIKADNYIRVGQVILKTPEERDRIIRKLKSLAFRIGVPDILFQIKTGTTEEILLSEKYSSAKSWAVCYKDHCSSFPLHTITLNFSDIDSY